jgi:hypothetical protein
VGLTLHDEADVAERLAVHVCAHVGHQAGGGLGLRLVEAVHQEVIQSA